MGGLVGAGEPQQIAAEGGYGVADHAYARQNTLAQGRRSAAVAVVFVRARRLFAGASQPEIAHRRHGDGHTRHKVLPLLTDMIGVRTQRLIVAIFVGRGIVERQTYRDAKTIHKLREPLDRLGV